MKIIRTLFSVRFAALVLVACTLFTGVMYRRQATELRQKEHTVSILFPHLKNESALTYDIEKQQRYSASLEKRLGAYESTYPEPKGAPSRATKPIIAGKLVFRCPL